MKFSIAQKLIAAFVGLTLLVLTATLGLARWSFDQGFLDYVNALEQMRLEQIQVSLADEYRTADGSWESLNEHRFTTLVRRSTLNGAFPGPPSGGMPPPEDMAEHPRPRGPRGSHMRARGIPPTALYDVNNNFVAGASLAIDDALAILVAVIAEGNIVGELRSEPRRQLATPLETAFSKQQLKTSWILGVSSLILAFAVSLLLARGLLAPVRRMIYSVKQLSNGDYSHRMNERRRDELGLLTQDLDRLGATLEASQSSRKRLLADVSHELRTPLTVLTGEIEALKDGLRKFDRTQLASLDQEVQRLRFLVDDLYELSIADVGGLRYQFETVNLKECMQNAVERMQPRAAKAGIALTLANTQMAQVSMVADARRIDQLLQNLIENSLAYTDAPGRVTLALSCEAAEAVIITINDTLPSVDSHECEQLFDPLFRHETSRSRRTGGAGLGLAICRNIVTAHDGIITASPSALGGLSIRVEIPLVGET